MTDTAADVADIDDAGRAALVPLVLKGMSTGEPTDAELRLVATGLATQRGPMLMPTAAGVDLVQRLCRLPEGSEEEAAVGHLYRVFLPLNRALRQVCTDWQVRAGAPNDHSDAAYDAEVRDRLDDIQSGIDRIVRRLADVVPGLAHYRADLAGALERFDDGDLGALTAPIVASYHTVWMWLHHELLLLLGISRVEDERLEEEIVTGQGG